MRVLVLAIAAVFIMTMPTAVVVKAEDTTIIKKDRAF